MPKREPNITTEMSLKIANVKNNLMNDISLFDASTKRFNEAHFDLLGQCLGEKITTVENIKDMCTSIDLMIKTLQDARTYALKKLTEGDKEVLNFVKGKK